MSDAALDLDALEMYNEQFLGAVMQLAGSEHNADADRARMLLALIAELRKARDERADLTGQLEGQYRATERLKQTASARVKEAEAEILRLQAQIAAVREVRVVVAGNTDYADGWNDCRDKVFSALDGDGIQA